MHAHSTPIHTHSRANPVVNSGTGRLWMVTHNNYADSDLTMYLNFVDRYVNLRHITIGKEVGPVSGTPHLHIVLYFNRPVRRGNVLYLLNSSCLIFVL